MTDQRIPPSNQLRVAAENPSHAVSWKGVVDDVSRVLALEPLVELWPDGAGHEPRVEQLLARAAAVPGPVIVLPAGQVERSPAIGPSSGARLHRLLVPSDASEPVTAAVRALNLRFQRRGVQTVVLHVMTGKNRPPIWEGAGHNAASYFDELRRRHGAASDPVWVVNGEPGREVRVRAGAADVVVLLWSRDVRPGHATVIRSLLHAGIGVPHLLIPLQWIEVSESADMSPHPSSAHQ